eukprot:3257735-Prymnesium_polylepis.3
MIRCRSHRGQPCGTACRIATIARSRGARHERHNRPLGEAPARGSGAAVPRHQRGKAHFLSATDDNGAAAASRRDCGISSARLATLQNFKLQKNMKFELMCSLMKGFNDKKHNASPRSCRCRGFLQLGFSFVVGNVAHTGPTRSAERAASLSAASPAAPRAASELLSRRLSCSTSRCVGALAAPANAGALARGRAAVRPCTQPSQRDLL